MKSYDEMYTRWELKTRLLDNSGGIKVYKRDKTYYATYNNKDETKDIKVPEFVEVIDTDGFSFMGISSVYLPDSIRFICSGAFEHCRELSKARFPNNKVYIMARAFYMCGRIEEIYIKNAIIWSWAFSTCKNLKTLRIDQGEIRDSAFSNCKRLEEVILGDIEKIGDRAFYGCNSLKRIVVSRRCKLEIDLTKIADAPGVKLEHID